MKQYYLKPNRPMEGNWYCPKCDKYQSRTDTVCWNCGASINDDPKKEEVG